MASCPNGVLGNPDFVVITGSGAGGGTCSDFLAGVGGEEEEIGEFVIRQQGYTFQKRTAT